MVSSTTDDNGEFRLWNLVPGDYTLTLMPPPWVEINRTKIPMEIESGQNSVTSVKIDHVGIKLGAAVAMNELNSSNMN